VKPKNSRCKPHLAEYSLTEVGNYKMFGKNLEKDNGRGLLLYINKELNGNEVQMESNFEENLFVQIKLNNNDKLLIGIIYRSPSERSIEHNSKLRELLVEASNKGFTHILIIGDFNYPEIDWENYNSRGDKTEYKFVDTVQDCFLFQHINKPTRWKGTQKPNILDLILTNEEQMVNNIEYSSPLGKSDHCMLSFDFNCYIKIYISQRNIRLHNRGRFQEFRESLGKMEWESLLSDTNDIDQNWNKFN
jgi:hypothetical protein